MGTVRYEVTERFKYNELSEDDYDAYKKANLGFDIDDIKEAKKVKDDQPMMADEGTIDEFVPEKDRLHVEGQPLGLYCPGGGTDIVPQFIDPDGKHLWARCCCGTTWYFRFPVKLLDKAKPDKEKGEEEEFVSAGDIPSCPCHGQQLEVQSHLDLKEGNGIGTCGVSGKSFRYVEKPENAVTKEGLLLRAFGVTPEA